MQIDCSNCHKTLNLPDAKLPVGKPFSFTCPYCKHKNSARIPAEGENAGGYAAMDGAAMTVMPPSPQPPAPEPQPKPDTGYQPPDQPGPSADPYLSLDENTLKSIVMGVTDERPKSLVVYDEEEIADMLAHKLEALGYEATVAVNLRDAAKQLKFASFDIVLIQEDYYGSTLSGNHLLKSIQNLDNQSRRGMLVILISPTMTTLDDLLAFSLSFNAVINKADLDTIDRILLSIIARAKKFYAVYQEILIEHGFD